MTPMTYEVELQRADARPMAAVRGTANVHNISKQIPALLSQVWEFLRASDVPHLGLNVVLYHSDPEQNELFFTDTGIPIEAGVLVPGEFDANETVIRSELPQGQVATTVHFGPYDRLPAAHAAIRDWCSSNAHALAGPNWEIYGHWNENPEEVRTDVFYLVSAS